MGNERARSVPLRFPFLPQYGSRVFGRAALSAPACSASSHGPIHAVGMIPACSPMWGSSCRYASATERTKEQPAEALRYYGGRREENHQPPCRHFEAEYRRSSSKGLVAYGILACLTMSRSWDRPRFWFRVAMLTRSAEVTRMRHTYGTRQGDVPVQTSVHNWLALQIPASRRAEASVVGDSANPWCGAGLPDNRYGTRYHKHR